MADSNIGKHTGQGKLTDDDPFAELTRIMGHEPGEAQSQEPDTPEAQPQDDLALDLEQELMGGSSPDQDEQLPSPDEQHDNPETPAPAAAPPEQDFAPAPSQPEQGVTAPEHVLEDSVSAELEQTLRFENEPAAPGENPQADQEPAFEDGQGQGFMADEPSAEASDSGPDAAASVTHDPNVPIFTNFRPLPDPSFDESPEDRAQTETFGTTAEEPVQPESQPAGEAVDFHDLEQDLRSAAFGPAHAGFAEPQQQEYDPTPEAEDTPMTADDAGQSMDLGDLLSAEELTAGLDDLQAGEPVAPSDPAAEASYASENAQPDISGGEAQQFEWQPAMSGGEYSGAPESAADPLPPEIETVELSEKPVALEDNLDIPDVHYDEEKPPARQHDEIEEILAGAFGGAVASNDLTVADHADENSPPRDTRADEEHEDQYDLGGMAAAGAIGGGAAGAFAAERADAAPQSAPDGDWANVHGWDDGKEPPLTPAPGVSPPVESGGSRWGSRLVIAGCVVAAIAVLGGVSVYALNFGDGSGSDPIRISADNSPVKVKPEDPGGVQIPNQDNQVYKRVSGEDSDVQPTQANLVSTTEDPMDLPASSDEGGNEQAETADTTDSLPGVGETVGLAPPADDTDASSASDSAESGGTANAAPESGEGGSSADETGDSGMKIQDRLASSDPEASGETGANDEVVSLAPRRVRSLVVRPDGTMVPNDAPQSAANDGGQADASATAESDSGITIPDSGPIPPSRPARVAAVQQEPSQTGSTPARATQQQQPEPQSQQDAAAPATQQSAASKWSVQIASQPTVEGAQQSYQTLAQRFGNVLQGKGVNIVKAEIEGRGTFYRVRIPSSSKDDAIQLCSELKSAGGSCFVSQ